MGSLRSLSHYLGPLCHIMRGVRHGYKAEWIMEETTYINHLYSIKEYGEGKRVMNLGVYVYLSMCSYALTKFLPYYRFRPNYVHRGNHFQLSICCRLPQYFISRCRNSKDFTGFLNKKLYMW